MARRPHLAHQLDRADVDAQLERGRGHQGAQVAGPQAVLDAQASVLGQAAVVGRHLVGAEALTEEVRQALRQPAGVDEHQRRAVVAHVVGDAVDHLAQLLGGGHRAQLALGHLDAHRQAPGVPAVDDGGGPRRPRPGEEAGRLLDGPLGGRQPDALGAAGELQVLEALQGEREVRAALVARQGVDLVDDHAVHVPQHRPAALRRDEQVEALGCGHEEGRRVPHHGGARPARGVAGAHGHRDGRHRTAELAGHLGDLRQRPLEVLVDVDGQGLQG